MMGDGGEAFGEVPVCSHTLTRVPVFLTGPIVWIRVVAKLVALGQKKSRFALICARNALTKCGRAQQGARAQSFAGCAVEITP